ncbi:hypothetical protein [Streptomyces sp. NPDC005423]|uniref:hypothetical protein n=1 Tax=Streptomyces sp. NPDC005423 TaxID=3155343 RepID=UPI0033A9B1A9
MRHQVGGAGVELLPGCVEAVQQGAVVDATRSQDDYFLMMTPLWLAATATVPSSAVAHAWQPRLRRLTGRAAKAAVATALVAPALLCACIAAASPPPLRMTLTPHLTGRSHPCVTSVTVRAANTTGTALIPHFASRLGQGASNWWTITSGPPPSPRTARPCTSYDRPAPPRTARHAAAYVPHRRDRNTHDDQHRTIEATA